MLFLVWNITLALIPYIITVYLKNDRNLNKRKLLFWFGIWLLFLPNSAYLMTDLVHLKPSHDHWFWLDLMVLLSFTLSGLFLFFLSIKEMKYHLEQYFNLKRNTLITIVIIYLSAFGIYLGRFLRFNSWEIISNSSDLFSHIWILVSEPESHQNAWVFILVLGTFLLFGNWVFDQCYSSPSTKSCK